MKAEALSLDEKVEICSTLSRGIIDESYWTDQGRPLLCDSLQVPDKDLDANEVALVVVSLDVWDEKLDQPFNLNSYLDSQEQQMVSELFTAFQQEGASVAQWLNRWS